MSGPVIRPSGEEDGVRTRGPAAKGVGGDLLTN